MRCSERRNKAQSTDSRDVRAQSMQSTGACVRSLALHNKLALGVGEWLLLLEIALLEVALV